ncbi:hypothetical protein ES703_09171 [subsurface metagenome]
MGFFDRFRKPEVQLATRLPRGRVSLPPDTFGNIVNMLEARYNLATPFYPWEFLKLLRQLSWANPDVAQAIGNIVNLGNTGHRVNLEGANDAVIEKAAERLSELARNGYKEGAGIDGLINQLFTQLAITGALSIEWCPDKALTKIKRVVIVPVDDIRFRVDEDGYTAFQMSTTLMRVAQNLVELNPLTYVYYPLSTSGRNPYGIPPFLAVLPDIYIQQDMKDNIKYIIRKFGLLGFVVLTLGKPGRNAGEADEEYIARMNTLLEDYTKAFSEEYRQGFGVTFDNVKIEHHNVASDKGADMGGVFQAVEQQIASALHTDPALLGRTYSTTETYAGVVYQKFVNQLNNMRRLIKRAIERGYLLDLELSGLPITDVSITFNPNDVLEPERAAKAEEIKIRNVLTKRDAGIIDQEQSARELGYEAPAGEAVPVRGAGMMSRKEFVYSSERSRYVHYRPRIALAADEHVLRLDAFYTRYANEVEAFAGKAAKDVIDEIVKAVGGMSAVTPRSVFVETVLGILNDRIPEAFASPKARKLIKRHVDEIYKYYRTVDSSAIPESEVVIEPKYNLVDRRALNWLQDSDSLYMGKYLSGENTQKRLTAFLKDFYVEKGVNIRDRGVLEELKGKLGTAVKAEDYKLRRVVNTSANRIRNWAHTSRMYENGILEATVVNPMDKLTCKRCEQMNGTSFSIAMAFDKIRQVCAAPPEALPDLLPFDKTMMPPFHCDCRCRIRAKPRGGK